MGKTCKNDKNRSLSRWQSEPQLDESTGALLEGEAPNPDSFKMAEPKNRKRNRGLHCMTNDKINMTCVEWMSRNRNSTITIDKVERPYSSLVLWTHRLHVIQDILLKQGFAVLGLHVPPDPGKTDEDTVQVWSLNQFYSVDFLQSRIGVKKCVFIKRTIKVCVSCC